MNEDEIIRIETQPSPDACVIWLHGLGADGNDFVPLVNQLDLPKKERIRFLFPNAPVRPITINQGYRMRGWFDVADLDIVSHEDSAGIQASGAGIADLIHEQIDAGIEPERIVIGGFSQGGAVALYCGLGFPRPLAGIVALSCYLPQCAEARLAVQFEPMPVFMAHGQHDEVVDPRFADAGRRGLEQAGFPVEWHEYTMGHSVCTTEINDIRNWLLARLAS